MRTIDPRNIEVVDDQIAEILRGKTPAERIAMVGDCNRTVRSMIAGRLKHEHPAWSEQQIQQEVARRMLDDTELWELVVAKQKNPRR